DPGIEVAESRQCLEEGCLNGDIVEKIPRQDCANDSPRIHENGWVVNKDIRSIWKALWCDKADAEEGEAHKPWCDELDERDSEVTDSSLQTQSGALQALWKEVSS